MPGPDVLVNRWLANVTALVALEKVPVIEAAWYAQDTGPMDVVNVMVTRIGPLMVTMKFESSTDPVRGRFTEIPFTPVMPEMLLVHVLVLTLTDVTVNVAVPGAGGFVSTVALAVMLHLTHEVPWVDVQIDAGPDALSTSLTGTLVPPRLPKVRRSVVAADVDVGGSPVNNIPINATATRARYLRISLPR